MSTFAENNLPAVTPLPPNPGQVDVVHARIRDVILRGALEPGDQVRQERVAQELQVSRTPVREALRMLEREGLVESFANRSYRVSGFSLSDMEQLYVVRLPLEAMAIRLSIPKMDTQDLAVLKGCIAQMETYAAAEDYEQWEGPHRTFHARLIAKGGPRIGRLVEDLSAHSERYRRFRTFEAPRAWSKGFRDHRLILEACIDRDASAGARHLARHLFRTAEDVIRVTDSRHALTDLQMALAVAEAPVREEPRI